MRIETTMTCLSARVCAPLILCAAMVASSAALADVNQAQAAFQKQDYKQALREAKSTLANDPDNTKAMFVKGGALAKLGRLNEAEAAYRALTQAHPDVPQGWNNLGLLLAHQGNLGDARQMLSKALDADDQYSPAHESLGDVYVALAQSEYVAAARVASDARGNRAEQKSQRLMTLLKSSKLPEQSSEKAGKTDANTSTTAGSSAAGDPANQPGPGTTADTSTPQGLVYAWADAWASQQVSVYLSMYAEGFQPVEPGQSRSAWAGERRQHIRGPSYITVQISDLNVSKRNDRARVTFSQRYQSNTYHDVEIKALILTRTAAGWRILREGQASDTDWAATD